MNTVTTLIGHRPAFPSPHGQPRHCVVCDAVLRPALGAPDRHPTCHAIACRMVVSRRDDMDEVAFRFYLQRQVQQKRALAALEAAAAARRTREAGENDGMWSRLAVFARLPAGADLVPLRVVVPSGPARARPSAPKRHARYAAHLQKVAQLAAGLPSAAPGAAADTAADADADAAASSALPGRLCGSCGGGCCTLGADHAYLSPPILRRFMDAQPQLSVDEVVAAYVARMPSASQAGSCINHTRTGCSLPRAMRSDICNNFACDALKQLQEAQRGPAPAQVVLVVRRTQDLWQRDRADRDNTVNGAAVLCETGARRMPMKSSGCDG